MTYEKAIKVLRWALNKLEGHHYITDDYGTVDPSAKVNAFGIAIEALEKQMPKKLKTVTHTPASSDGTFYRAYFCPNCGIKRLIAQEDENGLYVGRKQEYCDICGQAIDWGVSE